MEISPSLTKRFISLLASQARIFGPDSRANIAVIFAITLVPLLGFVGAAVDYARLSAARSSMQAAMDSAVLMVSKDAAADNAMTSAQVTAKVRDYFNALFHQSQVSDVTINATYASSSTADSSIKITGHGSLPTPFLAVIGFPQLSFDLSSTTAWGNQYLRIAMALDNTGSMGDNNKIGSLRTAAKKFVDTMSALSKTPGDVYISLVPFAREVNVHSINYKANWIDWTDWDRAQNGANHATWTGCVMDRTQPYDVQDTAPVPGSAATLFPADEYNDWGYYCKLGNNPYLQPMMGLTTNWSALKASIEAMQPTGRTNQPIGLFWAWYTLNQSVPLPAPAEASNINYLEAIVLMSDGLNTRNRWSGNDDPAPIDARQRILCSNIKAKGIKIYTLQVNTTNDPTSQVMKDCATDPSYFQMVTSSGDIGSAFDKISVSLTKLRISR